VRIDQTVYTRYLALALLGGLLALPACTSGQSAVEPTITTANLTQNELQFQVGTANLNGTPGLNTVTTFRGPQGFSAVLVSTPTITLPFTNTAPVAVAGIDSGTNSISATPQQLAGAVLTSANVTTFGQPVGAFSYGLDASNSTQLGANNSAFYSAALTPASGLGGTGNASGANTLPYYSTSAALPRRAFYVGPPFIPNFKDGTLGTGYSGAPSGFTTFELTPVAGTYTLNVVLPALSQAAPTFTATTALGSTVLLAPMPTPVYTSDHAGGGTVTLTVPPGIRETMISIQDVTAGTFYTLVVQGSGPQTVVLPPNLGTITGGVAAPSIKPGSAGPPVVAGDAVRVIAVGFDYPAMEAVGFGSGPFPQAPVLNNGGAACTFSGTSSTCSGQADLTMSNPAAATVTE
jgi:hypothetical protein